MSNPSFSNIDLWLFELAEGNLTPAQIEQLEAFLLNNPELDIDRDMWEMAKVDSFTEIYPDQEKLKRRKPIAWYTTLASVGVLALLSAGGYLYQQSAINTENLIAKENSDILIKEKLLKEINELKAKYESERLNAQNNSQAAEGLNANSGATNENGLNQAQNSYTVNNSIVSEQNSGNNSNPANNYSGTSNSGVNTNTGINSNLHDPNSLENASNVADNTHTQDLLNSNTEDHIASEKLKEKELIPREAREVDVYISGRFDDNSSHGAKTSGFSSGAYKVSLKTKWNRMARSMQRMMDNPIALKNFRDPYYHVPGMLPGDVSFSSAGTLLSTRVQASSRLQWYGQENEQLMNQLAIDGYVYNMRGGIGLQINQSMYNNGGMNIANVALTYSPKMSINKSISFEPSIRFKMGNKSINKTKMSNIDQVELDRGNAHSFFENGGEPTGNDLWYKDMGAGLMVNTEWFFAGFQVDNLFRHRDNIYAYDVENPRRADHHFVGTIGTDWVSKKENWSVSPYLVYQNMEKLSEAWLGVNLKLNWLTVGGAVSSNLEPSGSIGLKFDHVALSYNADYTRSEMTNKSALSHQLTLRFVSKPSRFGKRLLNL